MIETLTLEQAASMCGAKLFSQETSKTIVSVTTDTRKFVAGSLFFALQGKNYDGHQFIFDAFQKGALAAVVDEEAYFAMKEKMHSRSLLVVPDVYKALGNLARSYRNLFHIPVIAVTGSAGKTTTKECLRELLGHWLCVRAGAGNLNNHIGLPLNLLQLTREDQVGVFEIGASSVGEIEYLCSILKPTVGVLTCIQPVHLEGFGSVENIYRAKLELAQYLGKANGTLFVYGDDARLVELAKKACPNTITFGKSKSCHFILSDEKQEKGQLAFQVNRHPFRLAGEGLLNIMNALPALAVADHLGHPLGETAKAWQNFVKVPNRFQFEELKQPRVGIIRDCYNANPVSFKLALDSFCNIETSGKRIVVAGDMLELGDKSREYHFELGRQIGKLRIDLLVAIGKFAKDVAAGAREFNYSMVTETFQNNQAAANFLTSILHEGDLVFVKGSRGMKLEEVVEELKLKQSAAVQACH